MGQWVKRQREAHQRGVLAPSRIEDLDKLGMSWRPADETWNVHLERWKAYCRKYNCDRIPANYTSKDGIKLGSWARAQRGLFVQGKLRQDRMARLQQAGFSLKVEG